MPDHKYYLNIALQVAKGSKCKNYKVGSVIVDDLGRLVSTGYNGAPRNSINDSCEDENGVTIDTTLHSELNAILFSKRDLRDCILYTTLSPCLRCSSCIVQAGIKKVYYIEEYTDTRAFNFLREHGVEVQHLSI